MHASQHSHFMFIYLEVTFKLVEGLTEWSELVSGCQNVRNRNLAILSRSRLKMHSLAVGHVSAASYGKPRITNQVKPVLLQLHFTPELHFKVIAFLDDKYELACSARTALRGKTPWLLTEQGLG